MSKKLNATQEKLIELMENAENIAKTVQEHLPFDFECSNDYCPGHCAKRATGIAWRTKDHHYGVFCEVCGQEDKFSREDFKALKQKFSKERTRRSANKNRSRQQEKTEKAAA